MAYSATHLYLTLHGSVTNLAVQEQWQVGLRIQTDEVLFSTAQLQTAANDARADCETWWSGGIRQLYTVATSFDYVKLAVIGTDGKYGSRDPVTSDVTLNLRAGGSSGPNPLPAQNAVVATLLTSAARGYANKGRIYLPAIHANNVTLQGGITQGARETIANVTAGLLNDLNNVPGIDAAGFPWTVSVMSQVGAGVTRPVIGVAVGERFDTQRRRAEKFPESPFTSAVTVS